MVAVAEIRKGSAVRWTQRHPWTGDVIRTVDAFCSSDPFPVVMADGRTVVELVNLTCHRVARVADLNCDPAATLPPKRVESKPLPRESKPPKRETPAPKTETRPAGNVSGSGDVSSSAVIAPVNVLAIDFLNLLVRAWHVGKPTETHAVRSLFQTTANAIRKLNPQRIVFAMDGGHDLRSSLLPAYKAHRPPSDPNLTAQKELAEQALQIAGFQTIRITGWEADDVLASLAASHPGVVIVSSDKDLLAMAGRARIYHPWGAGEFVTPESKLGVPAGQVTDFLAMVGDTSDGIPGVVGIGEKTAGPLLEKWDNLEGILTAAMTGRIVGAIGKKLKEQNAAALLCRRVVELNTTLPLPELTPRSPRAAWQNRLQDLRLGSVVAILDALPNPETTPPLEGVLSAPSAKGEQDEIDGETAEAGNAGSELVTTVTSKRLDAGESHQSETDAAAAAGVGLAGGYSISSGDCVFRSISEPIRQGLSIEARFHGPDRGVIFAW